MRAHRGEHTYESTEDESGSQGQEAHCVQACAVETHMDMSQKPFCVEIYRTNAGPEARKRHFVCKFTRKVPDPEPAARVLCEPAQSKHTWTFHKSQFVR